MTTGSFNNTSTWFPVITDSGPGMEGYRFAKTWSGLDYPAQKPTYTVVYSYPYGTKKYIRQKVRQRPPKRARVEDHPYSASWSTMRDNVCTFRINGNPFTGTWANTWGTFSVNLPWDSNDDLTLLGKLRLKVAGSDFNFGVFLAEAGQSLQMIGDAATRLARTLHYFKGGNLWKAAQVLYGGGHPVSRRLRWAKGKILRPTADNWVQYVYGVKPLLSDIYSGAEFLGKVMNFPMVDTYRVTRKVPGVLTSSYPYAKWTKQELYSKKTIIAHVTEVDIPMLSGLTDPASILWEITPWSFVSDWAIPVGNYLSARGLANSLSGKFVTTFIQRYDASVPVISGTPFSYSEDTVPLVRVTGGVMTRTVSTQLDAPLPSFKGLGKAASWQHCANAVALLIQQGTNGRNFDASDPLLGSRKLKL